MATDISAPLATDGCTQRQQKLVSPRIHALPRIFVRYSDDVSLSVSGADNLWRLIVAGNSALPDSDPRKITRAGEDSLRLLAENIDSGEFPLADLLPMADALCDKLRATVLRG